MLCDLVEDSERRVVRRRAEIGTPQITVKALDAPDKDARFQIERGPVTFRADGNALEHNAVDGAIVLLSFEAPKPSTLASQWRRKGRELRATGSLLG